LNYFGETPPPSFKCAGCDVCDDAKRLKDTLPLAFKTRLPSYQRFSRLHLPDGATPAQFDFDNDNDKGDDEGGTLVHPPDPLQTSATYEELLRGGLLVATAPLSAPTDEDAIGRFKS
jgi:hypothetical protein